MKPNQVAVGKVFMTGRSQAIRLPKAFRFDVDEVSIKREGDSIVLTPKRNAERTWAQIREMAKAIPDSEWDAFDQALVDARSASVPDVPRDLFTDVK